MKLHIRGKISFLISLFVLFFSVLTVEAGPDVLRVGYIREYGYMVIDAPYSSGYAYEYMEELADYGNWRCEYVEGTWEECLRRLQTGEIDVMPGVVKDDRLAETVTYVDIPMGNTYTQLSLRGGVSLLDVWNQEDRTLRLGYLAGEYKSPQLPILAQTEGFAYDSHPYPSVQALVRDYARGRLDGFVTNMIYQTPAPIVDAFDMKPAYLAVRKGDQVLCDRLNSATDEMLLDDPAIQKRLFEKYYQNSEEIPLVLNKKERDYLKEKKTLIVAVSPDQKPFSYFENGVFRGRLATVLRQMADDLGLELQVVPTISVSQNYTLLETGQVDLIADFFADSNWALVHHARISAPYMSVYYIPVFQRRKSIPVVPRIACVQAYHYFQVLTDNINPQSPRLYYDTLEECLQAVSKGDADLTYISAVKGTSLKNYPGLTTNGSVIFSHSIAMAVKQTTDRQLLGVLNSEIRHLNPEQLQQYRYKEIYHMKNTVTIQSLLYNYPVQFICGIMVLAAFICVSLFYSLILRRRHMKKLRHLAYTDSATGFLSMWGFEEKARLQMKNDGGCWAIVVVGISRCSILIESYGREFVRQKLIRLGRDMKENEAQAVLTAARPGMGQIICLCPYDGNITSLQQTVAQVVRDHDQLAEENRAIRLELKAGLCAAAPGISVDQLVRWADTACRSIYHTNRTACVVDEAMHEDIRLHQHIENTIEKALSNAEFKIWYQPKYELRNRRCIGAEAWLYWKTAEREFFLPGQFLDIFERSGFILQSDFYVLRQVGEFIQRRIQEGRVWVPISMSQSRLHLTETDYVPKVLAVLHQYDVPAGAIELEINERAFGDLEEGDQWHKTVKILQDLRQAGVLMTMDHFGSGYSSLSFLNRLPLDAIKIDSSFLKNYLSQEHSQIILERIIDLARELHLTVWGEGIETEGQAQLLQQYGCCCGQGPLYAGPMEEEAFVAFLEKQEKT